MHFRRHSLNIALFGFSVDGLHLDDVLQHPYTYEQNFVKAVNGAGGADLLFSFSEVLEISETQPIKIEGYERHSYQMFHGCQAIANHFDHRGPVTCHLFKSPAGGKSFPEHTDPDRVIIIMLEGTKEFKNHHGDLMLLKAGDVMEIPPNYHHQAFNLTDNLMLSIGLESFNVEKH